MFRSSSRRDSNSQVQDGLGERFDRLEADVQARLAALAAADASLEERVQSLEASLKVQQDHEREFREDITSKFEEILCSQEAEDPKRLEASDNLRQVSDAVAALAQECSICASNSRVDGLQEELAQLSRRMPDVPAGQSAGLSNQMSLQVFQDRLADQSSQLDRLHNALCGNGDQLRAFMDEETLRQNNLRVEGATAEWLVRDVEAWINALPKGKYIESPPFVVTAPGGLHLDGLRLRFYPNGGDNLTQAGYCSLYLSHPSGMPWASYELVVGRARRGNFDPIFAGADDFCALGPELYPLDGVKVVRLCVRFLPLNRLQPASCEALGSDGSAPAAQPLGGIAPQPLAQSGPVSWGEAPQAGHLWQSSNRLEAA